MSMSPGAAKQPSSELPAWYRPSDLLACGPRELDCNDQNGRLLLAVLSDSGRQGLFEQGWRRFRRALVESCADAAARSVALEPDWLFVDESTIGRDYPDAQVLALADRAPDSGLPTVVGWRSIEDGNEYMLHIPAELKWFDGHFPDDPILPAVVQVDWVICLGRWLDFDRDRFAGFARLKFMGVIQPDMLIRMTLRASANGLDFVYESVGGVHSKGTVKFSDASTN